MTSAGADDVFAEFRLNVLENRRAAGESVSDEPLEDLRERIQNADPACWSWPAPETCSFRDEESAGAFLSWWNQVCAICGCAGELVNDHDHGTGLLRGRLCASCNVQEGRSDAGRFRKYRERNPASILGVTVRYFSPFSGYAEPEPVENVTGQRARRAAVDRLSLPSPDDLSRA